MNRTVSNRPYHHGDLRDAILHRAAEIVGEEGIEALSLRAIARDLGVSHAAPNRHFKTKAELLSALAATAWFYAREVTLAAAEAVETDNPYIRLNAMGRGFLGWALDNRALFTALMHPDVARYAYDELEEAKQEFMEAIRRVVIETQQHGRHPDVDPSVLTLYTNSVPFGIAALLRDNYHFHIDDERDQETLIAELIELVVPVRQFAQV